MKTMWALDPRNKRFPAAVSRPIPVTPTGLSWVAGAQWGSTQPGSLANFSELSRRPSNRTADGDKVLVRIDAPVAFPVPSQCHFPVSPDGTDVSFIKPYGSGSSSGSSGAGATCMCSISPSGKMWCASHSCFTRARSRSRCSTLPQRSCRCHSKMPRSSWSRAIQRPASSRDRGDGKAVRIASRMLRC
jgi:hypothetical protein